MRLNLITRVLTFAFTIFLPINFVFFSFQHYIPPSLHKSVSYTILNCPSHSNQDSLSYIIKFITKSKDKEGNEKLCLCFTCCNQRAPFVICKLQKNLPLNEYVISFHPLNENHYLKEFYTSLSIRSPPTFIV
jgi:hypothetical protein